MSDRAGGAGAHPVAADLIWDVRETLGKHGEAAVRLAYHAALPVVVDSGLLNLLRVNFFLDPPDDLPYEVEAELLMSPLFREVSEGLYELAELRNLLLTGLYSPPYGSDRVRRVAALLEQYTDTTTAWRSLPALEAAQRLTAVSFLDPELASRWLDENEAGLASTGTDSATASADLRREWYVAMRRRADERADVADFDTELDRAAALLDYPDLDRRLRGLRSLGTLARLPGADSGEILDLLCRFVEERGNATSDDEHQDRADLQEALSLLGALPGQGIRVENAVIRAVSVAGLDFSGSRFERVTLMGVNAKGVNLTGARLEDCTLIDVVLDDGLLVEAQCQFISMRRVSLQRVSIIGASIMTEFAEDVIATHPSGAQWHASTSGQPRVQDASAEPAEVTDSASHGQSVAKIPTLWGEMPPRNKNFTGRTEVLDEIRLNLAATRPVALQGLGGIGKTATAVEYAYRYRKFYDLVWWIPADQRVSVRASLANLATHLGLAEAAAGSVGSVDVAVRSVLNALLKGKPFSRWLLIYDNADQPEEILDLIPTGEGEVLITSRNHHWQFFASTVSMDVFTRVESTELLLKSVPKGLTRPDADRLAERLDGLPIALVQAQGLLSETGMQAAEYLHLLDEQITSLLSEGKAPDYPYSMTAAWAISVAALQHLPQALTLLRFLSFFGSDPIPRDLLRRGLRSATTEVSDLLHEPILVARSVRELGRFALISTTGQQVTVHRLTQALVRDELSADEQARYRQEVHLRLAAAAPSNPDNPQGWPRFHELIPHLTSPAVQLEKSQDQTVRELALKGMRYLLASGDPATCRTLAELCIPQWTADSGPDSADVARAQRHLDDALRQLG